MVKLTNNELRALFVQYQHHPNSHAVHIFRGLFGKLHFDWEEPHTKEALLEVRAAEKEAKKAEEKLNAAKRKAKHHR